jgi:hypothetical protein
MQLDKNTIEAIDKALRWHPSSTNPSYEQIRKECLAMIFKPDEPEAEELPAVSRASHL